MNSETRFMRVGKARLEAAIRGNGGIQNLAWDTKAWYNEALLEVLDEEDEKRKAEEQMVDENDSYLICCNMCPNSISIVAEPKRLAVALIQQARWDLVPYEFEGLKIILRFCPTCNDLRPHRQEVIKAVEILTRGRL